MNYFVILAVVFFVVRGLMSKSRLARYYFRMFGFGSAVAISGTFSIISALVLSPLGLGMHVNSVLGHVFSILAPLLSSMHMEIVQGSEYLEYKEPTVYMCNHQATLDMLALGGALPKRCVVTAKKEVKFIPVMGQVMWAAKNMFIDRKNRENAILALDKVAERMKSEQLSIHCFPEGTRSMQRDNSMLPFKKGFFHMAKKFGFPIVPIVVSTYYPVYDEKEKIFERGTVQVKVLPPISTKNDMTVDELISETRNQMIAALKTIRTIPDTTRIKND